MAEQTKAMARPMDELKRILSAAAVKEQFQNALQEHSSLFVASIIDLYGSSVDLQACDPGKVVAECLKAATLKLPINRALGFAWIIPYSIKGVPTPQFQLGYKGITQLALRTGQYRYINTGVIYEGIEVKRDILTGMVAFEGKATSGMVQGYFAYLETLNGFKKTTYMTKAEVLAHATRFSKSFKQQTSPWNTDFDSMAMKTCLRQLLSKFGFMSIEMAQVFSAEVEADEDPEKEIEAHANKELLPEGKVPAVSATDTKPEPTVPQCFQA